LMDNGIAGKPIWCTEAGWLSSSQPLSDEMSAAYLARSFVLMWASGIQRFYWYAWDNHSFALQTTTQDSRVPTAAGRAYATLQAWLVGARMQQCSQDKDGTWVCELSRDTNSAWIIWNPNKETAFTTPASWRTSSITPLLQPSRPASGSRLTIGPIPLLVTGQRRSQP
jgi:hypothetical protein